MDATEHEVTLRPLEPSDVAALPDLSATLAAYLDEQRTGRRSVLVAESAGSIAGYVTLLWAADDPVFRDADTPEISDLRVFTGYRRRGIGSALLEAAEAEAATRGDVVGLNVGLHSGYGAAQRIYARRGYVPDGSGALILGLPVPEGATISLDDDPIVTLRMTKRLPE